MFAASVSVTPVRARRRGRRRSSRLNSGTNRKTSRITGRSYRRISVSEGGDGSACRDKVAWNIWSSASDTSMSRSTSCAREASSVTRIATRSSSASEDVGSSVRVRTGRGGRSMRQSASQLRSCSVNVPCPTACVISANWREWPAARGTCSAVPDGRRGPRPGHTAASARRRTARPRYSCGMPSPPAEIARRRKALCPAKTPRWSCSSVSWRAGRSSCAGSTAGGRSPPC